MLRLFKYNPIYDTVCDLLQALFSHWKNEEKKEVFGLRNVISEEWFSSLENIATQKKKTSTAIDEDTPIPIRYHW